MIWRLLSILAFVLTAGSMQAQDRPRLVEPNGQEQSFRAYVTGYSFFDGSLAGDISHPHIHDFAGGVGTYTDPITIAVGSVQDGMDQSLDFPAGTRFYMPHLRKYAIVEHTCGQSDTPCHLGQDGLPRFDIFVDGYGLEQDISDACKAKITNIQTMVMEPGPNHSVMVGPLTQSGCFTYPDL